MLGASLLLVSIDTALENSPVYSSVLSSTSIATISIQYLLFGLASILTLVVKLSIGVVSVLNVGVDAS